MGGAYKVKKLAARDSHFLLNDFLITNFGGPGGVFGGPGGGLGGPRGVFFSTGISSGFATASTCSETTPRTTQKTPRTTENNAQRKNNETKNTV